MCMCVCVCVCVCVLGAMILLTYSITFKFFPLYSSVSSATITVITFFSFSSSSSSLTTDHHHHRLSSSFWSTISSSFYSSFFFFSSSSEPPPPPQLTPPPPLQPPSHLSVTTTHTITNTITVFHHFLHYPFTVFLPSALLPFTYLATPFLSCTFFFPHSHQSLPSPQTPSHNIVPILTFPSPSHHHPITFLYSSITIITLSLPTTPYHTITLLDTPSAQILN